jgi:transcriptional regulator with XRE-family HTH domain
MENPKISTNPNAGVHLEFTLGDRLRKAREYAGLEIQELASAVDVHRQSVTRYETDRAKPKRGTVLLWSMATGVSVAWLETGTDAENASQETAKP